MMTNSNSITNYRKLLRLRTIFKSVSQLTWNITKLEQRFPLDTLTEEETVDLMNAYIEYADLLFRANDELANELQDVKNDQQTNQR